MTRTGSPAGSSEPVLEYLIIDQRDLGHGDKKIEQEIQSITGQLPE